MTSFTASIPVLNVLADSPNPNTVPSKFNIFSNDPTGLTTDSLPIIDFSTLTAADLNQRSSAIRDLGRACQEWGFFILVNHGMPEKLMEAMINAGKEYFDVPHEDKKPYEAKSISDPIECGDFSVSTASNKNVPLWRRHLKLHVHPEFHCPEKPKVLREILLDYTERSRKLVKELIKAVADDLELDHEYVDQVLKMDSCFELHTTNVYPPCPEPEKAIGLPPHTDFGLFSLLIHNRIAGLQIQHNGNWFNVDSPQNSILVNCGDHLEIFTNGRCKSVKHRAVLNKENERSSIVVTTCPSKEAVIGPAAPLLEKDGVAFYNSMKFSKYLELVLTTPAIYGKTFFEKQRIQGQQIHTEA